MKKDSNNMGRIIQSIAVPPCYQDPINKVNQISKNNNDNGRCNNNINNKKIPHKPHKLVISFLGYKHDVPWE
ncbi:hypothetical protein [Candidatus Nitrosocosmicus oleophilus]|uniref:hypothetical protein n=1 Tax=Candidatus Nitrosocosmicus oleophilus TaxID=1353260 RepID=UPI0018CA5824|nr:hypothetical protein [Candidatus Nitrosocosmicus oleophilus]